MVRPAPGQAVWVATTWHHEPVIARVVEARFAYCTVRYCGGVLLYTHDWSDVHLCIQDALNRLRVLSADRT